MGQDSEEILEAQGITEEELKKYSTVVEKFDEYFNVRANPIYERARLSKRIQEPGETAEQYILALYALAENYGSVALKQDAIRDRLVVGMRDARLSQRLQLDSKLTLEKAKTALRQAESVREQHQTLQGAGGQAGNSRSNPIQLDLVRPRGETPRETPPRSKPRRGRPKPDSSKKKQCTRCGHGSHSRADCPARDATCHKCQRKGHYSAQCFSKSVPSHSAAAIEESLDVDVGDNFLDAVTSEEQKVWTTKLLVGAQEVTFKLDTGAGVTAVSEVVYQSLNPTTPLHKPSKILYGPDRKQLQVLGQFVQILSHSQKTSKQQIFVVKGLRTNLLGLPAITALNLAARLDSVEDYRAKVLATYPVVFTGLGNLGEPYTIELKPDARPHASYTPRRVPYPLRDKVKKELERMETIGVISRVEKPTPWCAGMVAVQKKSGNVRICVDLKPLNESVLREIHPLPKVDDVLAQLSGATVSKLDAIAVSADSIRSSSRHLTTFLSIRSISLQ